jgi:large subunit ribosomal protein L29
MRPEELRDKTEQDLQDLLSEKREALSNLRFKRVTDVIEDPSKFEKTKRDIARILTILNEGDHAEEQEIEA